MKDVYMHNPVTHLADLEQAFCLKQIDLNYGTFLPEKGAEGWLLNVKMEIEILEIHDGRKTGMRIKGRVRECLNIKWGIRKSP